MNQASNENNVIISDEPLPSDGTAERPQEGRRADKGKERIGSLHDCTGTHPIEQSTIASIDGSMAVSVTRHAPTPPAAEFKPLLYGIDSLDLGFFVAWGPDWKRRLLNLNKKRQLAGKKGGLLIGLPSGRTCIFKPGGKDENYRFHLQFEAYNLYLGKAAKPGTTPNVYVSLNSRTLWLIGIDTALSWITDDLKTIGRGTVQFVQASRVDLCADFWILGGLSYAFLKAHKVTRNKKDNFWEGNDDLETWYVGDKNSPIQLRGYNKGKEVTSGGTKGWFLDLWNRETADDIWRFEFQVRRAALRQFGINSLDDLKEKQAGLWQYLTTKWFSLRLPDNKKAERRTIHPLWSEVQNCFSNGSPVCEIKRVYRSAGTASPKWYLSHIEGCLSSFAALRGITNRNDALDELKHLLKKHSTDKDFEDNCTKKAIQRGTLSEGGER
ncbi:MAG: plasmid replication initiation factor [Deltaproteobacteria bacterium]|nr:plasmid replication initiation factor [Deltaproteobacteria bacterium]MBN2686712.1 plasmid replication initiation factor [Deltaproteobacteria bacterium]